MDFVSLGAPCCSCTGNIILCNAGKEPDCSSTEPFPFCGLISSGEVVCCSMNDRNNPGTCNGTVGVCRDKTTSSSSGGSSGGSSSGGKCCHCVGTNIVCDPGKEPDCPATKPLAQCLSTTNDEITCCPASGTGTCNGIFYSCRDESTTSSSSSGTTSSGGSTVALNVTLSPS